MAHSKDHMMIKVKKDLSGLSDKSNISLKTDVIITCPYCGHQEKEKMPIDSCVKSYVCLNCKKVIKAPEHECCVFCAYGDSKCPPKQLEEV